MTDVRLPASGNILVRWHAAGSFVNAKKPTAAEINAGLKLGIAASWNDFDFGLQASTTNQDPALASKGNVADRGAMQYGGSISFYYPKVLGDASNNYALVEEALREPRTLGYISIQLDGELSESNTATYTGGLTQTAATGDFVSVYKVMTAGYTDVITGEQAFRYTISFLPQGEAYPYVVIAASSTVAVTPSSGTVAAGDIVALKATLNTRDYTRGVRWTTSDSSVATVSQNGIVTIASGATATDTATITAEFNGATSTYVATVA